MQNISKTFLKAKTPSLNLDIAQTGFTYTSSRPSRSGELIVCIQVKREYMRTVEARDYRGGGVAAALDTAEILVSTLECDATPSLANLRADCLKPPKECELVVAG